MKTTNNEREDDKRISSFKKMISRNLTDIENRDDLSADEKATKVIHIFSATCAGVATQPIPFMDIFLLTPIQMYMAERLAAVRGVPMSQASITEIVTDLGKVILLGMLAQQAALGLYKVGLPILAGFTTIPLVYGLTYAIGKVLDYLVIQRAKGVRVSEEEIKDVWKKAKLEGKKRGKDYKKEEMKKSTDSQNLQN